MRLNLSAAALIGLAHSVVAAGSPKPWEISYLTTFSPPGRPGSSLYSVINITIADPNDSTVSPTNCIGKWTYDTVPYNITNACSEVPGGKWTFEMLESNSTSASPTTDFKLRFELDKQHSQFVGTASFAVGDNLSGLCSAGGICAFELKEEDTPFPVYQVRV
ncbi:3ffc141b-2c64-46a3-8362-d57d2a3f910a [Thermothielavioides terrestris]|uniref:AA1-like domain-containing protein n=2 Tax=Thermothielavioides terrestris TaxID=2587410 RepID=G2QVA5_THETT|nr:uncharacterized protein THITE_2085304 [Thermothielavioides terrestris NRRL 8126]AEO63792.1 hypothetical protein THITE_2085304 [Thermothielavioides terrestris NRRL 8126]SPQ23480.1 3ffc141b-2c64-46a3-8362-d57d2a3f910a [Thermothielavioides terrestris]